MQNYPVGRAVGQEVGQEVDRKVGRKVGRGIFPDQGVVRGIAKEPSLEHGLETEASQEVRVKKKIIIDTEKVVKMRPGSTVAVLRVIAGLEFLT